MSEITKFIQKVKPVYVDVLGNEQPAPNEDFPFLHTQYTVTPGAIVNGAQANDTQLIPIGSIFLLKYVILIINFGAGYGNDDINDNLWLYIWNNTLGTDLLIESIDDLMANTAYRKTFFGLKTRVTGGETLEVVLQNDSGINWTTSIVRFIGSLV